METIRGSNHPLAPARVGAELVEHADLGDQAERMLDARAAGSAGSGTAASS